MNEFREKCSERFFQNLSDPKQKRKIELFLDLCKQGPSSVSVICNRCINKKRIKIFNESDYKIDMEGLIFQLNSKNYISHKCHETLKKVRIPVQRVFW